MEHFRSELNRTLEYGPVVVHCSDGCSRSGIFICIDQLLESIQKEVYFDIKGTVSDDSFFMTHIHVCTHITYKRPGICSKVGAAFVG